MVNMKNKTIRGFINDISFKNKVIYGMRKHEIENITLWGFYIERSIVSERIIKPEKVNVVLSNNYNNYFYSQERGYGYNAPNNQPYTNGQLSSSNYFHSQRYNSKANNKDNQTYNVRQSILNSKKIKVEYSSGFTSTSCIEDGPFWRDGTKNYIYISDSEEDCITMYNEKIYEIYTVLQNTKKKYETKINEIKNDIESVNKLFVDCDIITYELSK